MDDVCGIILAAGASTRMKTQKMLLPFGKQTVIDTVVRKVTDSLKSNVVVVLGSDRERIREKIEKYQVKIAVNENYIQGMLSSVIIGLNSIPDSARAILIFLGDQPQIPEKAIIEVINSWKISGNGIVIPVFNGRRGHPVLIESKYKKDIENLNPEKGLRDLMDKNKNHIFEMICEYPEILRDMDTPEEYVNELKILKNTTYTQRTH